MPGGTLQRYLHKHGASVPLPQLAAVCAKVQTAYHCSHRLHCGPDSALVQMASAACFMESLGIVHRNLGAHNVLVGHDLDHVRLTGFRTRAHGAHVLCGVMCQ
jgi:serine/threonine protein kinase